MILCAFSVFLLPVAFSTHPVRLNLFFFNINLIIAGRRLADRRMRFPYQAGAMTSFFITKPKPTLGHFKPPSKWLLEDRVAGAWHNTIRTPTTMRTPDFHFWLHSFLFNLMLGSGAGIQDPKLKIFALIFCIIGAWLLEIVKHAVIFLMSPLEVTPPPPTHTHTHM